MTTYWVSLSYATYLVDVSSGGVVTDSAPIARWMVGKRWTQCEQWARRKGARIETLDS
jgi:hypothetical protein